MGCIDRRIDERLFHSIVAPKAIRCLMMFNRAFIFVVALSVAACQANEVEIKISNDDIIRAAKGETVYVNFEAEIGEDYTTIDDEKRETIGQVADLLERYFPGSYVEVDIGSDEYTIELESEIKLSTTVPAKEAPWYLAVHRDDMSGGFMVSLQPTSAYDGFNGAMQEISFMLGPDEYQPVKYRISGNAGAIFFGGGYLDGRAVTAAVVPLNGERMNLSFKEGVWTSTGAGFIYIPE